MYRPPRDPRNHQVPQVPSWRGILVSYVLVAAIPLLLWVVSQPVTGTVVLAAIGGLFISARRGLRLAHCFYDCGGFAFNLGGKVQVCIVQPSINDVD